MSSPSPDGGATVQEPRPGATARLRRARLVVVSGPRRGDVVDLEGEGVVIGSQPPADFVLEDQSLSRRHAEIRRAPGGWALTDLGSTNGTWVGEVRIGSAYLSEAMVFRVGRTQVAFEAREEGVPLVPAEPGAVPGMVAESAAMRQLVAALRRFGPTDLSVVLEGETGAGKEVAARALCAMSRRASRPLVVVDCGALQENLVESELFGHERGAFTGAVASRAGAFEDADGGTIFLDEVGELPLVLQPKLLRALEAREVRRVGSNTMRSVDVRVIAATNRDLPAEVEAKRFRADLYFRLSEVRLRVPPLRERPEDVVPIALAVAREVDPGAELRPETLAALGGRTWRGNVRELANVVRRAVVTARPGAVGPEHIAPAEFGAPPGAATIAFDLDLDSTLEDARERLVTEFERRYLAAQMERFGGDVPTVAKHAGIHEHSLYRLLRSAGIRTRR